MQDITLERSGQAPLRVRAEEIASSDGRILSGKEQTRYHQMDLYRLEDGRYALSIVYSTQWAGELGRCEAFPLMSPGDVTSKLSQWDPTAYVAGFPAAEQYKDRQARLLTSIRHAWDHLVTDLLRKAGDDFAYQPLTAAEKRLVADSLNGCHILIEHDKDYLAMMAGEPGYGSIRGYSALEHEISDSIELDQLDDKWGVDAKALLSKLSNMGAARRSSLVQAIAEIWSRNDNYFERDLDALEI